MTEQFVSPLSRLAKIGIVCEVVDTGADNVRVRCTAAQGTKVAAVVPAASFAGFDLGKCLMDIPLPDLGAAYAANLKAPREAVDVAIASRTEYVIDAPKAANPLVGGWFSSDTGRGQMYIGELTVEIQTGKAGDFYEIEGDTNPDRTVYFVELDIERPETGVDRITLTAYGVTNLFRRVANVRAKIIR